MDIQTVLEIASRIDIANILIITVIIVYFYNRLDNRMDKRFEHVDKRFDKIESKIEDMDRRLCRLEGAFSNKDCCMIKDDRLKQKAE